MVTTKIYRSNASQPRVIEFKPRMGMMEPMDDILRQSVQSITTTVGGEYCQVEDENGEIIFDSRYQTAPNRVEPLNAATSRKNAYAAKRRNVNPSTNWVGIRSMEAEDSIF